MAGAIDVEIQQIRRKSLSEMPPPRDKAEHECAADHHLGGLGLFRSDTQEVSSTEVDTAAFRRDRRALHSYSDPHISDAAPISRDKIGYAAHRNHMVHREPGTFVPYLVRGCIWVD